MGKKEFRVREKARVHLLFMPEAAYVLKRKV